MIPTDQGATSGVMASRNHPLALRMGLIAFLNQNITIACVWGSFSVLLIAVEARLGIDRKLSVLALPALNLATAVFAPLSGILAARYSLRLAMLMGSVLSVAGFAMLALTHSFPLYMIAFGLLLGPGMASVGVVFPPTLVTRWFTVNRGRALGLTNTPLAIAAMPLFLTWVLQSKGLAVTYAVLAGISAAGLLANFFVIDRPPDLAAEAASPHGTASSTGPDVAAPVAASATGVTAAQLLRSPRFWAVCVAAVAPNTSSIILTAHMVPLAQSWGFSPRQGAVLLSMQSLIGIAGTILFGAVVDRLGGVLTLALLAFNGLVLYLLLLLHPPFLVTAGLIGLIGLHGAGVLPVTGTMLGELFGRESFSRAYGICNVINLPFSVACVPAAAWVYERSGSYSGALIGQACFFAIALVLAMSARQRSAGLPTTREADNAI
jgi:MFS family permease